MKSFTTTESNILSVEPFIHTPSLRYIGPVVLEMTTHEPSAHEVVRDDDGTYRHRIVWPDHSGVHLHHKRRTLSGMTLKLLHRAAHDAGLEIESMHHGQEHH